MDSCAMFILILSEMQQEASEKQFHMSNLIEELEKKKEELVSALSNLDLVNLRLQQQAERSELMEQQHRDKLKAVHMGIQKYDAEKRQQEEELKGLIKQLKDRLDDKQGEMEKEKQVNVDMNKLIKEKEQKILQLSGFISVGLEKENQRRTEMNKLIEEKENTIYGLQEELKKERQNISNLKLTVEEKDTKITQLSRSVQVFYGTIRNFQQQAQKSAQEGTNRNVEEGNMEH
eukprot:TRINITY_DN5798_c0_g3_i5.p1 TRINITY_DN5798_c0_g3~~TRINITY_DN5798_c0_g3_i5.p1  ORF type:complete len:232 (+),score=73.43 TRINITY_DN5798_c0_g3_i5:1351-2046(+)